MFKKFLSLVVAVLFSLSSNYVYALPEGEQVISGSANFERLENTLNVTTSDKVIINYNSFSIGEPERVNFYQPSAESVALNRVVGVNPSEILGVLTATGKIYLINPNGILFGPNSQVDVKGLIASTLDIKDSDFLNGNLVFVKNADKVGTSVVNKGKIYAKETALLGSAVRNEGTIVTTLGKTVLASGEKMTLGLDTAGMISVTIDEAVKESIAGVNEGVKNTGKIYSDGGVVVLTAKALDNIFNYAVNNEGVIEANTLEGKAGKVELTAEGNIKQSGRISANAPEGETAGNISIIADGDIVLESGSVTEAKALGLFGDGGKIIIDSLTGGVSVKEGALIDISAGALSGDSGSLEVSAFDNLGFYGTIKAKEHPWAEPATVKFSYHSPAVQPVTIMTDKTDYAPTESPIISGSGFMPNQKIVLNISAPDGTQTTLTTYADSEGCFTVTYTPESLMWGAYLVTSSDGARSAVTRFTDAPKIQMYKPTVINIGGVSYVHISWSYEASSDGYWLDIALNSGFTDFFSYGGNTYNQFDIPGRANNYYDGIPFSAFTTGISYYFRVQAYKGTGYKKTAYSQYSNVFELYPLTITANDVTKTYGETYVFDTTYPSIDFSVSGLQSGDSVNSVSLSSPGAINTASVGNYDISVSNAVGSGLDKYLIEYNNGTLTVTPKALIITANSDSKTYGTVYTFDG
ncbi:MAG: filamentous hemagglutinin N-terminal domain-containing protein, partial [Candidatus Omnitrophica bacterium]|nr:filamentous hemagglutinin N-terminal domain-containing protein [Candidatus Omnitrophota bacterium]